VSTKIDAPRVYCLCVDFYFAHCGSQYWELKLKRVPGLIQMIAGKQTDPVDVVSSYWRMVQNDSPHAPSRVRFARIGMRQRC
jgi:hypothetical protein